MRDSPIQLHRSAWGTLAVVVSLLALSTIAAEPLPPLKQVLQEAEQACEKLAERDKAEGLWFQLAMARGSLVEAFALAGDRERSAKYAVAALGADEAQAMLDTLDVQIIGIVPSLPESLDPKVEIRRRFDFARALSKRDEFEKAREQIAAMPDHPNTLRLEFDSYCYMAERQLERKDERGARATADELWKCTQKLDADEHLVRCWRIMKTLKISRRFSDLAFARKLCAHADEDLAAASESDDRFNELPSLMRELAVMHAALGNHARARSLLQDARKHVRSAFSDDKRRKREEFLKIEIARAKVSELAENTDQALAHYARARTWAKKIDDADLFAFAEQIDDSGMVSAFLAIGTGSELKEIILGQLAAGDEEAAVATWAAMPLCLQKLLAQVEMAKHLHAKKRPDAARECAERCRTLDNPKCSPEEIAIIWLAVAVICHEIGDEPATRQTLVKLLADPRVRDSIEARQMIVGDLVELGFFKEAYQTARTIQPLADRALPLARLALGLAKRELTRVDIRPPSETVSAVSRVWMVQCAEWPYEPDRIDTSYALIDW